MLITGRSDMRQKAFNSLVFVDSDDLHAVEDCIGRMYILMGFMTSCWFVSDDKRWSCR